VTRASNAAAPSRGGATGARLLVEALKAHGVDTIFGIPGIHNLTIYDALYGDSTVRLITCRDERGAAHMADGYARVRGRPGVCLTVPGPGVTNALTGIAEAYADSSPVLLLASQLAAPTLAADKEDFHQLRDTDAVLRSVTAWGTRPASVDDVGPAVAEAFQRFHTARPRPCYLELPMDLLAAPAEGVAPATVRPCVRAEPDPEHVAAAVALLARAGRPLLLLGGGARDAAEPLRTLAERLAIPVVMSSSGKGVVPEDHPLSVGDGWMAHQLGREALERADCVLAVGCRFGPLTTSWWSRRIPGEIVHVDIDASEIGKHQPAAVGIVADASAAARALLDAVTAARMTARQLWLNPVEVREARRAAIRRRAPDAVLTLEQLRAVLPDEAVLFNDINGIACWGAGAFVCREPRTFHYPIGFGCLGFALPAAIGGKIAAPRRPVVALSGDGGFLFTGQELATAVRERLDLVAIVFNDNGYGTIKSDQAHRYPGRAVGGDLSSPDFVRYAEAFGARGLRVDALDDLPAVTAHALALDGPTVIEAPCPQALPPWIED
jgi:thiamine pyrophosphate-dependent acetolactate synthase large subunit-like protein